MKRFALLFAVVALGATGLSYWSGRSLEREFQAGMRTLGERPDFPGQVETTYRRGVFQSTATTTVAWAAPGAPPITMEHRIVHGPIPWAGLRHGARPGSTCTPASSTVAPTSTTASRRSSTCWR